MYRCLLLLLASSILAEKYKYFDVKFDEKGAAWYRGKPGKDAIHSLKWPAADLLKVEKQDALAITFKPTRSTLFRVFAGQYNPEVDKNTEEAKWGQKLANGDGVADYRQTEPVSRYQRYQDPENLIYPQIGTANGHLRTLLYMLHSSGTFKKAIATLEKFQKEPIPVVLGSLAAVLNYLDHGKVPEKIHIQALERSLAGHDSSLDSVYAFLLEKAAKECEFGHENGPLGLAYAPFLPLCYLRVKTSVAHVNTGYIWDSTTSEAVEYEDTPLFTLDADQSIGEALSKWRSKASKCPEGHSSCQLRTERSSNTPEYFMMKVAAPTVKEVNVESEFYFMNSVHYYVSMIMTGQDIFVHDIANEKWKKLHEGKLSPLEKLPSDAVQTGSVFLIKAFMEAHEKYQEDQLKVYNIRPLPAAPVTQSQVDEGGSSGETGEKPAEKSKSHRAIWMIAIIMFLVVIMAASVWYVRGAKPEDKPALPVHDEKA